MKVCRSVVGRLTMLYAETRSINNVLVRIGVQFLSIATADVVILARRNCARHDAVRNKR